MRGEKPETDAFKWAERIKQARWRARFIPWGIGLFVAVALYCVLFPVGHVLLHDKIICYFLFVGALAFLFSLYFDEKYFLRTGQERLTFAHTLGLLICAIGFSVSLYYDHKEWHSTALPIFALSIYLLNRVAKHVAAFREARPNRHDQ